ncbi:hypothetical protein Ccrd_001780, partial [Cynara cardunculus var. scolymus]
MSREDFLVNSMHLSSSNSLILYQTFFGNKKTHWQKGRRIIRKALYIRQWRRALLQGGDCEVLAVGLGVVGSIPS